MNPKELKWWEKEFLSACGLACFYGVELSLDQFCSSRGILPEEREALMAYLEAHSICS